MVSRDDRLLKETDFARLKWVKSSYSDSQGTAQCVEVFATGDAVIVRDSKYPPSILVFEPAAWAAFLAGPLDR
ncbi:DUF397 domain-containing protein [Amycolatopsis pittospori]|uniref:DUF397 domain-containing protein n=1 Tax=Amycolatopsis pittospori TaxID=2749434 RepID=UPI0015F10750|nr:DUF397 domain-containing protein [Amycolatopsis pittospori]